ncbi:MAG: response regulator [Thermodesulfobacteriota bacterium]|nr:response regulator [Thermodesulfobacteriota bacterium]
MAVSKDIKILVVDDFQSMRSLIKNILRKLGFNKTYEANDGTVAWTTLNEEEIDLVISDWNMPQMKGIDLLRKVRAAEEFEDLPFLMVTAEGLKENVLEALKAGVSGYIVKPFSSEALKDKIDKIFAKR